MRKVLVDLKIRLELYMDEGIEVQEVIDEMNYVFDTTELDGAVDVMDTSILDFEVIDSY